MLLKGCDPCFTEYQVQGGGGSGLPGCHQINKVTITQHPPNRSGHMLMGKTNNTVHPGYASYSRGTETAKVKGLWLRKDPNACVKTPR